MPLKPTKGTCDGKDGRYNCCGKTDVFITCKSRGQCAWCSAKYLNGKKKPKKPKPLRKKTGEYDVFLIVAATQPHVCYMTDEPVNVWLAPGKLNVNCFMHVVSKGADTRMRLWVDNIRIGQPWAHRIYDQGSAAERKEMAEKYRGWQKLLDLKDELKQKFNAKHKKSPID